MKTHITLLALSFLLSTLSTLYAFADTPFYDDKAGLLAYKDASGVNHSVATIQDWQIRRNHILENMQKVMGPLPDATNDGPPSFEVLEETRFPKYTRKKILYQVDDDKVPAFLLIPTGLKGKTGGIICPHPTNKNGKDMVVGLVDKPNRNYAEELAQRGYVTLAPDYPGFGDYAGVDVYAMGYVSATMKGIRNHMRGVDLLQSLPEVDPEKIAAIGHSLGGHNALFLGVFDPRIKVMVSSCGFNAFPKYYGGDLTGWSHKGYMPRIATRYDKDPEKMPFDWTEILAALAPRPVFVSAPQHDANFEVTGVKDCQSAAQPIYNLYNVRENLRVVHPDCEHDFPSDVREKAYAFLARHIERV